MTADVPRMASGTVRLGMRVTATLRRNTKMTATTRAMDSSSVNSTSLTEARMVWVRSTSVFTVMLGGMLALSVGMAAWMRSTVSITFAPGILVMASRMVRPLAMSLSRSAAGPAKAQADTLAFSGPSTATPMSRTRIGAPLRQARTTLFQGSALKSWSFV